MEELRSELKTNTSDNITDQSRISHSLTPILFGAAAFQYLNSACELGLFEMLNKSPNITKDEISKKLNIKNRATDILLLGVSSLKLVSKTNDVYKNSIVIEDLFKNNLWHLFKDVVAFEQYVVYLSQVDFTESLKTNSNAGLHRVPGHGRDLYHRLHENPKIKKAFYDYMHSWTELSNFLLFKNVDFSKINKILDVGGGTGINAFAMARRYSHLKCTILEIPGTAKLLEKSIKQEGLSERISVIGKDMFASEFPKNHDCILFSHQLVIWTPEENIMLLKHAYNALPKDGSVIIFSSISKDDGTGPLMAALDSVYFATLPAEGGMIYSWNQYVNWLKESGFEKIEKIACYDWTPHGIIKATK